MVKKTLAAIILICGLLCAQSYAVSLEQVQPVMPDISVFVHSGGQDLSGLSVSDISATLDGRALTVKNLAVSDEGIYYVFMLDISRSIRQTYLDAAKQAVLNTRSRLRPQDQLAVITFGDSVSVLLEGNESSEIVSQKIASVKSTDENTRFYDAMDTLVKTAASKTDMRHVAVMVSDGVEEASGDVTPEQVEQNLRNGGVAVYGLAVDSASEADLATFRNFVELSGGEFYVFSPSSAQQTLDGMLKQIDAIWCLTLSADSNSADGSQRTLEIKFGSLGTVSTKIAPTKYAADSVPPYVISLDTEEAAGTIKVVFSESMAKLGDVSCYKLVAPSGTAPALKLVTSDADSVTLSASGISKASGWKLSISGLTDASMEKNALPACEIPLSGVAAAAAAASAAPTANVSQTKSGSGFPIALVLIPVLAIAALAAALVYLKKHGGFTKGKKLELGSLGRKKSRTETPHFVFNNTDSHSGTEEENKK